MKFFAQDSNCHNPRAGLLRGVLFVGSLFVVGVSVYLYNARAAAYKVGVMNRDGSQMTFDASKLRGARLLNLKTGDTAAYDHRDPASLLIFFSPADCSSCLEEFHVWQSLSGARDMPPLKVVGIIVRSSAEESRTFIDAFEPAFDLYLDAEQNVERLAGLPHETPFKVLVDSRGRVLLADGPRYIPFDQRAFRYEVAELMRSKSVSE